MPTQTHHEPSLGCATNPFLNYARVELQFGEQTLEKYSYCLNRIAQFLGDPSVTEISKDDILALKGELVKRQNGVCWQITMLSALKRLLMYCRDQLSLAVLDPALITVPRRPRREVAFLTADEVERFVGAIPVVTLKTGPHQHGLRFRALVEILLGSAMRIGEVLSLDRTDIDFERREARVIGKGNKQRVVFFTERAIEWIKKYLNIRVDSNPALFATQDGKARLSRTDIWRPFTRYRRSAGIAKPVTPHLLRHTAATQLLFNGCPMGHIKEILGHERLETTCRYYLGLDRRAAKAAFHRYLVYDGTEQQ